MEFAKSKVEMTFEGKKQELKAPTALKAAKYFKEIKAVENDPIAMIEKSVEFLVDCGLEKEIAEQLELHQIEKIISTIATKKN